MRVYIQDEKNLIKYDLPKIIDGSFLFNYHSFETNMDYSLSIDAENEKWVLKNNENVSVSVNLDGTTDAGTSESGTELEDYKCIPLTLVGIPNITYCYCLPSIMTEEFSYSVSSTNEILIGSGMDNNIVFSHNNMPDVCAAIKKDDKENWFIFPAQNIKNVYVYVNSHRVEESAQLYVGDVVFINGLRFIWMKNFLKISVAEDLFSVHGLEANDKELKIKNNNYTPVTEFEQNTPLYTNDEYFAHMPRIQTTIDKLETTIDSPPEVASEDSEMPFLLSIGSSFSMLGMTFISGYTLFSSLSTGTADLKDCIPQIIMMSLTLLGSFLFPFIIRIWTKRLRKKQEVKRIKKYKKYLTMKEEELETAKNKQEDILRTNFFGYNEMLGVIEHRTRFLWNKLISDPDFLEIRVGLGERPSYIDINAAEEKFSEEDNSLLQEIYKIKDTYRNLKDVPITVSLKEQIVSALVVFNDKTESFLNWMMLQLLVYHSPSDLKIVVITDRANSYRWDYLRYSPHCWNDERSMRFFSTSPEDTKAIFQELDAELMSRIETKAEKENDSRESFKEDRKESDLFEPYYLIFTDDYSSVRDYKFVTDLLNYEYNYGFSMVVVERNLKNMPKECKKFIVLDDKACALFSQNINSEDKIYFEPDYIKNVDMRHLTFSINNVPIKCKDAESQLPTSLSFLEMYEVGKIEQLNIRNRWLMSDPMNTLSAPIGVHVNGDLFYLNLHEKSDGPHGLIAGSTGSGKSEFIITYILSMALNYDPKEVQFVLIDYKGGGLAGAFENRETGVCIPHLAGTITNLDTSEMNRTLVSIQSELKRRQAKFNFYKDKLGESTMDIYKYQRLYRDGLIDEPISHLFIISDEFAELKSNQPDFMDQLVSTARIGRSLGVHLILATQKPSGVVNDQIWANSRFKVCLKVQTRSDSMEMLKRPEAASIKEAGRFYLQVGYDEYFDVGQSAWSGARYIPVERIVKQYDDSIDFVNVHGVSIKNASDSVKKDAVVEDKGDQLTNIVRYLYKISKDDGYAPVKLWLPALKREIQLNDLLKKYQKDIVTKGYTVAVGEYDAPEVQEQGLLNFDLLAGNMLIYGAPASGKENLISTIVHYLCFYHSPETINFYIGDFGAETLKMFSKYPHVGDVFVTEDSQKLINMIKMISKELDRRKKDYSEFGGNYSDYCKLSQKQDPVIVVVINNYEVFCETYSRLSDHFVSLFRDGNKYGIVFIVSTAVTNALRSRVAEYFPNRVCLKMSNDYDYRDLLGAPRGLVPLDNYGRGVARTGDYVYEFQTADICNRDDKTAYLKKCSEALVKKHPNYKAKPIPVLPDVAYVDDYIQDLDGLKCVPIGVERNSLETYVYNFLENKINLIGANSIKNHIYFVYALLKQMTSIPDAEVHVIDVLSIYRGNYENVDLHTENFEKAFVMMYNNVVNDTKLEKTQVYFILGAAEFKEKIQAGQYAANLPKLFKNVSNCEKNTFIFLDDSDSYKQLQVEEWYRENINNTFGIWLGEGVDVQVTLGIMSIGVEEREIKFPCIGYPVYQGKHMIMKYLVDGVDRKDE